MNTKNGKTYAKYAKHAKGAMMIAAVDIETRGLDATKFILGSIQTDRHKKPETYHDKEALWERIKQLGEAERRRGKILNVYHHNANYDTAGYMNYEEKGLKILSLKPYITELTDTRNNKAYIKFLDTLNIYRMSLEKIGRLIGQPKSETPIELIEGKKNIPKKRMEEIQQYCEQDAKITLEAIQHIKSKLAEDGLRIKRIYTINQIAIAYLLKKLKEQPQEWKETFFWNEHKNETRRTFRANEIHKAYRGGRVEQFRLIEKNTNANYIDYNSLYPNSLANMPFPDLRTERKIWRPLKKHTEKELLAKIGISKCIIRNETNKLGLLPIRTTTESYIPKTGTTLIGSWTHTELKLAIKEGYKILDIEYSITWEETNNPFKTIIPKIYEKRRKSEFDNYFYKMMMNAGIGKFAQTRTYQEIKIDSIQEVNKYLNQGWKVIKGQEYTYMYHRTPEIKSDKPYYTPIIPTLVNAHARTTMYKEMKKNATANADAKNTANKDNAATATTNTDKEMTRKLK